MSAKLIDADLLLSTNEHWMKLDQDWKPVDLETEEDNKLSPVFSTLDLRKSTFDSSFLTKRVRRKVARKISQISKKSSASDLNYNDFLQDLEDENTMDLPLKQFYFISGQILSALSVEEICDKIDDIFKSVEKLSSATSTIRKKKLPMPEIVQCSISTTDLSFDDTYKEEEGEKEKGDNDDLDRYIDEAFEHLNSTIMSLHNVENINDATKESVTSLVKKFSSVLKSPTVHCSPRKKRRCSEQFRDLAEFWNRKALENNRG